MQATSTHGAGAGSILRGFGLHNLGIRVRVAEDQKPGSAGPITGRFMILDVGNNMHSGALHELLDVLTDAEQVVRVIRQDHPSCVSVVNVNILTLEGDEQSSNSRRDA